MVKCFCNGYYCFGAGEVNDFFSLIFNHIPKYRYVYMAAYVHTYRISRHLSLFALS